MGIVGRGRRFVHAVFQGIRELKGEEKDTTYMYMCVHVHVALTIK